MLSILIKILTIDDMQYDASDMLRFFLEVLWNGQNWDKKLIFGLIL